MTDFGDINLKNLLEHAHIGVVIHGWDTSIIYANPTALKLLRLSYNQIIGKDSFDPQWSFLDDAGKKLMIENYPVNKVKRTGKRLTNEVIGVIDSSCQDISWFMINAYYEGGVCEDNKFIIVTFTDISDSKQLFSFKEIVENTQDIVIITEANDIDYPAGPKIVYVNRAFEQVTGYRQDEVLGETPRLLQGTLTDKTAKQRIYAALKKQQPITETVLNYDATGRPYWVEMNIIPLKNKYGEVTHFAAIERDISERKFQQEQLEKRNEDLKAFKQGLEKLVTQRTLELQRAKAQLEQIAFFDPLTNIPNRRFFIDQANKLINACARHNTMIAFGFLDIDNFKALNDTYGHDTGDAALKELATIINKVFRIDDAFCRFGGEEFAFVISVAKQRDAVALADRLMDEIRDIRLKTKTMTELSITVSMGLNVVIADTQTDMEKELKLADQAMYEAKRLGKDRYKLT